MMLRIIKFFEKTRKVEMNTSLKLLKYVLLTLVILKGLPILFLSISHFNLTVINAFQLDETRALMLFNLIELFVMAALVSIGLVTVRKKLKTDIQGD